MAICTGMAGGVSRPVTVHAAPPPAGIISTFAGPKAANLAMTIPQTPSGLAMLGTTLYVADSATPRIYAINTTTDVESTVTDISGQSTSGGLAVDSGGNLYVSLGDRIDLVTPQGVASTFAGGGSSDADGVAATSVQFYPKGVAVDAAGNVFIVDTGHHKIREVDHVTGIITTVAGNGTAGYSGDGGPATSAELFSPQDVAVDASGNLWIADYLRIREVDHTTGVINTVAGDGSYSAPQCHSGPALSTSVSNPNGIWVSGSDVYFTNLYGFCVQKLSGGTISVVAGGTTVAQYGGDGGPATSAGLVPIDVTGDGAGSIYVSDQNLRVRKVSAGIITTVAGTGAAKASYPNPDVCVWNGDGNQASLVPLCGPTGVTIDAADNLYVAESLGDAVRKITPAGVISTVAGAGFAATGGDGGPATSAMVFEPTSVAVAGNGDIYIGQPIAGTIRRVDHATGIISTYAGCGCAQPFVEGALGIQESFLEMGGIALDASGNLYVADGYGLDGRYGRVLKIDTTSNHFVTTIAGGGFSTEDGILATQAKLVQPSDVAIDSSGDVLIADSGAGTVRKVAGGIITTLGQVTPNFNSFGPGVAVGPGDRVVAVTGNQVDVISTDGVNRIAGTATAGFSGDAGPATSAELNQPLNVAFDSSDNMYISDTNNGRIRKVTPYSAPGSATAVTAAPAQHAAVVRWTAPANLGGTAGIIAYEVIPYEGATPLTPVWVRGAPAATTTTIQLPPGQAFTFTVTPSNGWDVGPTSAASAPVVPYLYGPPGDIVTAGGTVGTGPGISIGQFPYSLAANGNDLYIGDLLNPVVRDLNITTGQEGVLAGNDGYGLSGDGGPPTAARINGAGAMTECSGVTYIADTFNYVIREIVGGRISTIAGTGKPGYSGDGGPGTQAQIGRVFGLACRNTGNGGIYFSDSDGGAVRIVDGAGTVSTYCQCFSFPTGIATIGPGFSGIAVSDSGADNIVWQIFDQGGIVYGCLITGQAPFSFPYCDVGNANSVSLSDPRGLAFDGSRTLYIADSGNNVVRTVDLYTETAGVLAGAPLSQPTDVALAGNGVFVADGGNYRVEEFQPTVATVAGNGTPSWSGDGGWATSAQLGNPFAVAIDASGAAYVADTQNAVIRKIDGATITTVAGTPTAAGSGGDGGPATSAHLSTPTGVAVDGSGNLFISDAGNHNIRKVNTSGVISTLVSVPDPRGIAVDGAGTIYVADANDNRVWRVSGNSLVAFAGTGVAGYAGDGQAATSAKLKTPVGVAVDSAGNVYIADTGNNVVRKVDHLTGDITTVAGNGVAGLAGDGYLGVNAELAHPWGVAIDSAGRVFIADTGNERVRMVDSQGLIHTVVGSCGSSPDFLGDGKLMEYGQLNFPVGLAVDPTGDLLIADVDNNRVRAAVAPFPSRSAPCQSPPVTPGPRSAGNQSSPTNPPRISDRTDATHARVADQPIRLPSIHTPANSKLIPPQSAPTRPVTTRNKSGVSRNGTPRGGGAARLRSVATKAFQAPAATAPTTPTGIYVAIAVVPLLLSMVALAWVRRKRKVVRR
ncbi:MAG TPA: hypothetical protein VFB69_02790 [Candidatus Dormibacteraeota bacterium]|nr:hypothetical protein [Candidatus Dormibacteraeota bacterium]